MNRYVRHAKTGERGELVMKDGQEIVVDPVGRRIPAPYKPQDWLEETVSRRMSKMQAAEIAYLADQGLQNWLGERARAKKLWISLREEDRIAFADDGPKAPPARRLMWKVIMGALKTLMEDV